MTEGVEGFGTTSHRKSSTTRDALERVRVIKRTVFEAFDTALVSVQGMSDSRDLGSIFDRFTLAIKTILAIEHDLMHEEKLDVKGIEYPLKILNQGNRDLQRFLAQRQPRTSAHG